MIAAVDVGMLVTDLDDCLEEVKERVMVRW
jgi:hypothetical protein